MTRRFQYRSEIQSIPDIRRDLESVAVTWEIPSPELKQITLIVEELFSHIIRFAFEKDGEELLDLDITLNGARISIEIRDGGIPFNPLDYDPDSYAGPASSEDGGMGISLIRAFADVLHYERKDKMNYLIIEKNIRTKHES